MHAKPEDGIITFVDLHQGNRYFLRDLWNATSGKVCIYLFKSTTFSPRMSISYPNFVLYGVEAGLQYKCYMHIYVTDNIAIK